MDNYIVRGTTPTINFTSDTDLTGYELNVAIRDLYNLVVDTSGSVTNQHSISASFTQEQTKSLASGQGVAQVKAINSLGTVIASKTVPIFIVDILNESEMNYT